MFDFGDTLALLIVLTVTAVGIFACLGAYARKQANFEQI